MLVAPLTDPVSTRGSVPHYLEAIAYVGVLNVNFEEDEWPQTAKVDLVKWTPLSYLQKACSGFEGLKEAVRERKREAEKAAKESLKKAEEEDDN